MSNQEEVAKFLEDLVSKSHQQTNINKPVDNSDFYRHVLEEYSELTRFYLNLKTCYLSPDLSKIKLSTIDERNREHFLEIDVNYTNKNQMFNIVSYDLPHDKNNFKASASLRTIYDYFISIIERLQSYFNLMDLIDSCCYILDPPSPHRRDNHRRIWIGDDVSMILTIDPCNIAQIPEIKFLGPGSITESYRMTMNENLEKWDPQNDIVFEILQLIGLEKFPEKRVEKQGTEVLMTTGDCSICFSQRLNNKLPEVSCKSEVCATVYHAECLYEWLMSLNTRRFFSEIIGNCPNCEKPISCPIPS